MTLEDNQGTRSEKLNTKVLLELVKIEEVGHDETPRRVFGRVLGRLAKGLEQETPTAGIKGLLSKVIVQMKRQNKWRRFSGVGKGILTLCARLPIEFRSELLLRSLMKILREASYLLSTVCRWWLKGVDLAYKLSEVAYGWGNKEALKWRYDDNYIIYLGMNRSSGFWAP